MHLVMEQKQMASYHARQAPSAAGRSAFQKFDFPSHRLTEGQHFTTTRSFPNELHNQYTSRFVPESG